MKWARILHTIRGEPLSCLQLEFGVFLSFMHGTMDKYFSVPRLNCIAASQNVIELRGAQYNSLQAIT